LSARRSSARTRNPSRPPRMSRPSTTAVDGGEIGVGIGIGTVASSQANSRARRDRAVRVLSSIPRDAARNVPRACLASAVLRANASVIVGVVRPGAAPLSVPLVAPASLEPITTFAAMEASPAQCASTRPRSVWDRSVASAQLATSAGVQTDAVTRRREPVSPGPKTRLVDRRVGCVGHVPRPRRDASIASALSRASRRHIPTSNVGAIRSRPL
jgi:hypothetical protein